MFIYLYIFIYIYIYVYIYTLKSYFLVCKLYSILTGKKKGNKIFQKFVKSRILQKPESIIHQLHGKI